MKTLVTFMVLLKCNNKVGEKLHVLFTRSFRHGCSLVFVKVLKYVQESTQDKHKITGLAMLSPANVYLLKVNNRFGKVNNSKRRSGVFSVNFKHISQLFQVFLPDFELVNVCSGVSGCSISL